jgi:3',5'-nucleoside bisphosphate phosphatase
MWVEVSSVSGRIDLHVHSKSCSDGKLPLPELMEAAHERRLRLISITDHDSIECQESAEALASKWGIHYLTGVELNITFSHPRYRNAKPVSLDILGYRYDYENRVLLEKARSLKAYRRARAEKILENINHELGKEGLPLFSGKDLEAIEATVDGAFGRPHIADYMVKQGLVSHRQAAFEKYLVKCNVEKMAVSLEEASELIRGAGGKVVLAHPNDPNGTSLATLTSSLVEQFEVIRESMLPFLDGVECWHPRHDRNTTCSYAAFAEKQGLMVTGGSDCHQQPIQLGSIHVPTSVARHFDLDLSGG